MGYDNSNRGALFKNDRKTQDNQPDYRGSVNVDGTDYWISGWIKIAGPNAQNPGVKFLSVCVEPKDGGFNGPTPKKPTQATFDDIDDDIPFSYGVA